MFIQNLSSDILSLSEKLLLSDISKLRNIVLSSNWLIAIKKELVSNSPDSVGESLAVKYCQNSKYKKLYTKFIGLIDSNDSLSNAINNFIKENIQNLSYFSFPNNYEKDYDISVFETEVIEKFDETIENTVALFGIINKFHNSYTELKEYIDKQDLGEEVIPLILDTRLQNLLYAYVSEINSNKNSERLDKKTKVAQDLNKQLLDEITSLKQQLQTSLMNESYKDKLLSNITEQMAIMHVDEIEDKITADLENEKILNENLKTEIMGLKREIEEKTTSFNKLKESLNIQISNENKFRYLFILMSFYAITITFILILHIRNMRHTRRYVFNRCHDIND